MEWHHPDSGRAAWDNEARKRYTQFLMDINTELLTNYGKIDILWYDVPQPMESWEGWDSLVRNQKMRELQPDLIINDRSRLPEDFGTPEERVQPGDRDWEACMTFNGLSWGYVDSEQVKPYSYNAQQIIKMLHTCAANGGNLLLNIGPTPDGSVPEEAIEPLTQVGEWLCKIRWQWCYLGFCKRRPCLPVERHLAEEWYHGYWRLSECTEKDYPAEGRYTDRIRA